METIEDKPKEPVALNCLTQSSNEIYNFRWKILQPDFNVIIFSNGAKF